MNANELADELERPMITRPDCLHFGRTKKFMVQVITMLRQQQAEYYSLLVNHDKLYGKVVEQQAEIDALKKEAALQRLSDFTQEADNKPVAWFEQDENMKSVWYQADQDSPNAIPLYTHPAKTLTDEEIVYLAKRFEGVWSGEVDYKGFARAILRKAQEK